MNTNPLKFEIPITEQETQDAIEVLLSCKVAIFVVAYEAEQYIENLLSRIPENIRHLFAEIYIIDDHSRDLTFEKARNVCQTLGFRNVNVFRTPINRGYGGNQKIGYLYAIERGYDIVIMLHGDAQYPPEYLVRVISPFKNNTIDAVFASRMITKDAARKGGMPYYKWLGNQVLTWFENTVLGTKLSEFHTGYRAYRSRILRRIPFKYNDDGFHFDTEIIIQVIGTGGKIKEVPIPTHYGDEVCHVNGISYAFNCMKSVLWYKFTRYGIFFDRRFDVDLFVNKDFSFKKAPNTVHQYIINRRWKRGTRILHFNAGSGKISNAIANKGPEVYATGLNISEHIGKAHPLNIDLEAPFHKMFEKHSFDTVIVLNGIEYEKWVGNICEKISSIIKPGGKLFVCTGNVAYLPLRILLLFGAFHYGKRGILDLSHTRLFTQSTFIRLIKNSGFRIKKIRGFGPPIRDMISDKPVMRLLDSFLSAIARIRPSLLAYQILVEAEKLTDVETVLQQTVNSNKETDSPTGN